MRHLILKRMELEWIQIKNQIKEEERKWIKRKRRNVVRCNTKGKRVENEIEINVAGKL